MPNHNTPAARAAQRDRILDGVITPRKPANADQLDRSDEYGGVWYQTSNETPFLYLPPILVTISSADPPINIPQVSLDVLVAVTTPSGDQIVLTGWFSFLVYEWQYYGVDPVDFDKYTPYYWRYMPLMPDSWADDRITADQRLVANIHDPSIKRAAIIKRIASETDRSETDEHS